MNEKNNVMKNRITKSKKSKILYNSTRFENIRDIISNSVKLYPNNVAFIVKHKSEEKKSKEVTYQNITYTDFQNDINQLGAGLQKLGYTNKRVAVIGKNSYEWAITYYSVINGLGVIIPLDKGLPENEIESLLLRSKADLIVFDKSYEDSINKFLENKSTSLKDAICMKSLNMKNLKL